MKALVNHFSFSFVLLVLASSLALTCSQGRRRNGKGLMEEEKKSILDGLLSS